MSAIFIISFSFSLLAASVNTCVDICVSEVSVEHPAYNFNEKDERLNAMSSENMILLPLSLSLSFVHYYFVRKKRKGKGKQRKVISHFS